MDLPPARVEAGVQHAIAVAALHAQRIPIVVVTVLAGVDQLRHQVGRDTGVLELVAARPHRHVEAGQIRAVVDRDPVVGDVVEIYEARGSTRDRQARDALCEAVDLGAPLGVADLAVVVVRIVDPLARIALRVLAADEDRVADLGAEVDTGVAVEDVAAALPEIEVGR
jgi:hypothetical protein